ncbi:histone-lysine N-methyltransferase ASHR3-like [Dorcoceras hygrometricum]|nr:histone-lysine N-methyltransferase ASHR3-like [Dorcoceras hygrometricum]
MPDLANFPSVNQSSVPAHSPFPEIKLVSKLNMSVTMELHPVLGVDSALGFGLEHAQLAEPMYDNRREEVQGSRELRGGGERRDMNPCRVGPTTTKHIEDWRKRQIERGVPEFKCYLPFLVGAPPLAKCRVCQNLVYSEQKVSCSVRGCQGVFHLTCARESLGFSSSKQFKCPQHIDQEKQYVGNILLIGVWKRRVQSISCSKACLCSEKCVNRPFRKEKKIQLVKTELCGWGVVAAESICKGDFVVEYVGEELLKLELGLLLMSLSFVCMAITKYGKLSLPVFFLRPVYTIACLIYDIIIIDDAMCEGRLWDMKDQGAKNFYMCEISKDFVIDATFKGNFSRFLNHSCAPNCKLEKWQVDGETRVGVFASRPIQVGESLTYDYRASKCQGYLGTRRRITMQFSWGLKGRRSTRIARTLMLQIP